MSLFTKVLNSSCKQALEPEKRSCFFRVIFVSGFHQLTKRSSSQTLEVQNNTTTAAAAAAAEDKEEEMVAVSEEAERLLKPTQHHHCKVKSLQEMPGPKTLSNLVEFFWKDGFGRIHEIQVQFS